MKATTRAPLLTGLFFLLAAALVQPISGQALGAPPVFLALPNTFPDLEARAALMMEPGRDIVVLRAGEAGPETLEVALRVLRRVRRDHPRPADRGQLVPITGFVFREDIDGGRREALEAALSALRQRPISNIGNLGQGRWMPYRAP